MVVYGIRGEAKTVRPSKMSNTPKILVQTENARSTATSYQHGHFPPPAARYSGQWQTVRIPGEMGH